MIKFGRNYKLTVQADSNELITIEPPFTIELDVSRQTLGSANLCKLRIYNLSVKTRSKLYFNNFNQTNYKTIQLQAGYGEKLGVIFTGNISQCWSVREGVNFITQIECYDGGFAYVNTSVNLSFPKGTPIKSVILSLMDALTKTSNGISTGISVGGVGDFPGTLQRANTYTGNPAQLLFEVTGGAFFIDGAKAYAMKSDEFIPSTDAIIVSDATGLLNTPVLERTTARFEMLFEPSLNLRRTVVVNSTTFPLLNGQYIITSVKHRGIISPVVSGELITYGEFFYSKELTPVAPL